MAEDFRAVCLFSGMVQGVGFRYKTRQAAAGYAVTGYVRNLPNGNVEVVAEGTKAEILAFTGEIRKAFDIYVDNVDLTWYAPTGDYSGFYIRH